jgi:hypothetical protein
MIVISLMSPMEILNNGRLYRCRVNALSMREGAYMRQRLIVLLILVQMGAWVGLPAAAEPPPLVTSYPNTTTAILVGPLTPAAADLFTTTQLTLGRQHADAYPENPHDLLGSNFYDLALVLYHIYYRTSDPYWLVKARQVAIAHRDQWNIQALHRCLEGVPFDWNVCGQFPSPRNMSMMGIAVLAAESGDAEASRLLDLYGDFVALKSMQDLYQDPRETGYVLMALAASVALGHTRHLWLAQTMLNTILIGTRGQEPSGRFPSFAQWNAGQEDCPYPYGTAFMQGLMNEALILYDRVIGDARIIPALQRSLDWLWTQWVPTDEFPSGPGRGTGQAFQYSDWPYISSHCGIGYYTTPNLTGLILLGFGYLDDARGVEVLQGFETKSLKEIWGVKQFSQMYRSASQYFGYAGGVATTPGVILTVTTTAPVTIGFTHGRGVDDDWIGLYRAGEPDAQQYLDWKYVNNQQVYPVPPVPMEGTVNLTPPGPGQYEARMYADDGFTVMLGQSAVFDFR